MCRFLPGTFFVSTPHKSICFLIGSKFIPCHTYSIIIHYHEIFCVLIILPSLFMALYCLGEWTHFSSAIGKIPLFSDELFPLQKSNWLVEKTAKIIIRVKLDSTLDLIDWLIANKLNTGSSKISVSTAKKKSSTYCILSVNGHTLAWLSENRSACSTHCVCGPMCESLWREKNLASTQRLCTTFSLRAVKIYASPAKVC